MKLHSGTGATGRDDEIDSLVRDAESRWLHPTWQGAKLSNLPVVFVIGEPGSTKTSTLLNSGLDPELLAGNVYQDNAVAPTRAANFWFARGMVFVEAAQAALRTGTLARLLQHLQPAGRRRAPRCSASMPKPSPARFRGFARAAARTLQARLARFPSASESVFRCMYSSPR